MLADDFASVTTFSTADWAASLQRASASDLPPFAALDLSALSGMGRLACMRVNQLLGVASLVAMTVCGGGSGGGGGGGGGGYNVTDPGTGYGTVPSTCTPTGNTICMTGSLTFSPGALTITKGSSVTWSNTTGVTHTVTFDTGGAPASSGQIASGTFVAVFATTGTFAYHCAIHGQSMSGTITVQ